MSTVFSTCHVPVDARVDYWQQVIDRTLMPLRGRHQRKDFRAQLVTGDVGSVRVAEATTPAGECYRTPKLVRGADHDRYQVDVVASGNVIVEQDGRQSRLGAGDIALLDPSRPVHYAASDSRHVSVLFPRAMLSLRADDLAGLTAVRISGWHGTGALVSSLARQLPRHLDDYQADEAVRLGTALIDLLGTALASRLDRTLPRDIRQRALLQNIYAFMDANLGDPALSPASVAAAHHISLRSLYKLFETEPTTVAEWVRQRRLDRCRRDLLDPDLRDRPVAAIATRWGLPDPAHFSRLFTATHGVPPATYRTMSDTLTLP
jgi:AraC-like DNA-binding protein